MSILIITILFFAAMHDLAKHKIPNYCVLSIIFIGIIYSSYCGFAIEQNSIMPIINSLLGLTVGLIICITLYLKGMFGAGDAKLLASLGVIFGPYEIVLIVCISISCAGILALFRLTCYDELVPMLSRWYESAKLGTYLAPEESSIAGSAVPMGGAILLATVFCEFYLFN